MRTITQLLTIVRDELIKSEILDSGLCDFIFFLKVDTIITTSEYFMLMDYLDKNMPNTFNTLFTRLVDFEWNFNESVTCHWWGIGKKKPRIKWLDKQIIITTKKG